MSQSSEPTQGSDTPVTPLEKVVPLLIEVLRDGDLDEQRRALAALRELGPFSAPAVPDLLRLLEDEYLREICIETLGEIGPDAESSVPALLQILLDEQVQSDYASWACSSALAKIGDPQAIPALLRVVGRTHDEQGPASAAVDALALFGSAAKDAIAPLLALLDDPKASWLRGNVALTLARITLDPSLVWPALLRALRSAPRDERPTFSEALYQLMFTADPLPPDAYDVFLAIEQDPDPDVAEWATYAIQHLEDLYKLAQEFDQINQPDSPPPQDEPEVFG